jgi:putative membrane protein
LWDPGLQPERTALAWRRTYLALAICSIAAMRVLPSLLGVWALVAAGLGLLSSIVLLLDAQRRAAAMNLQLRSGRPVAAGARLLWLSACAAAGGIVCLVSLFVRLGMV